MPSDSYYGKFVDELLAGVPAFIIGFLVGLALSIPVNFVVAFDTTRQHWFSRSGVSDAELAGHQTRVAMVALFTAFIFMHTWWRLRADRQSEQE